jgi:hypothetical protein
MGLLWRQQLRDIARRDFVPPDDDAIPFPLGTAVVAVGRPTGETVPKTVGERMGWVENQK